MKKIVAVSLIAATMVIPATGAFASDSTDPINLNTQITQDSRITSEAGGISILSTTWKINAACNMRATPSPTGTYIGSLYPGDLVNGNETSVVNGVTWVKVYSEKFQKEGWIQSTYLTEYGFL
ncbi:hypothetical protein [Paenibacillus sp. GCM10027626]|uniref:hypothetical protein n=1 Tax=Paenibacillus sp. GCM10027626 TaxID=3273411 RepID=UPI0036447B23